MGLCDFACPLGLTQARSRTHSQGVDQSTWPLQGGNRRRRDGQKKEKPRKSGLSLSSLLSQCHTLWPLSVTISLRWPWASGGWHSASSSIRPSFPISAFHHMHKQVFSLIHSRLLYLSMPKGFLSSSPHRCSLSPPSLPVQSYSTGPGSRLRDALFFAPSQSPPSLWVKDACAAAKKSRDKKTLTSGSNHSLMNDWCANADSSHLGKNQYFDLKHNKI